MLAMMLMLIRHTFAQDILIKDARIIDARGDLGIHSVLVRGTQIAEIDPQIYPADVQVIDASHMSMLPGLIDAHVHITMAPGEAFRKETPAERVRRHSQHMRAFLAWGVTTIVDPGISVADAQLIRQLQEEVPAPSIYFIGPLIGPKEGYPSNVLPALVGVSNIDEVRALMRDFSPLKPLGIKVTMEDGPLMRTLPLFSKELQKEIQQEAERQSQNIYVHATDNNGVKRALEMNAYALVHSPHQYSKKLVKSIVKRGVYVCSTLDIIAIVLEHWNPDFLSDPKLQQTVPKDEQEAAQDPEIRQAFIDEGWKATAPGWPRWIGRLLFQKWMVRSKVNEAFKMMRALHKEGAKIVLASDSSGWPIIPYLFHGPSTHFEIRLLKQVGLSEQEIITAATLTPAQMLGLEKDLGTIEINKMADIILVPGNPLEDISLLHQPTWVMFHGEIHRAEEWLTIEKRR